ncbi:FecR domain-containing protein [Chitinophaga niabensis]|uniref:FecR family protein n=1 Tax=Chitinophaga niabensis TaxID=536979 RepID=UPI0031BB09AE
MDKKTLEDFFKGHLTGEEREQVMQWVTEQGEGWIDTYIQDNWDLPVAHQIPPRQKASMKARVIENIRAQQPVRKLWLEIGRAAAILLLLSAGAWWWMQQQQAPPQWYTVSNNGGGHIMLRDTLPDGTIITLNEHSSLKYPSSYNKKNRTVFLSGEAFFEVHHDKEKPFIVKAGNASTRVYGTAFSVSAYTSSGQLRVGLQRGSIGVISDTANEEQEKMLVPGELLIYNKENKTVSIENQAPEKLGAWTTGKLVFFKTPGKDVFSQLEQRYDVHFSKDHEIAERTVTATFDSVPLSKVLQHISFVWNIRFEQRGDSIYVK